MIRDPSITQRRVFDNCVKSEYHEKVNSKQERCNSLKRFLILALAVLMLLCTACSKKADDSKAAEGETVAPTPGATDEPYVPTDYDVLTGLPVDEPSALRPYACMINNIIYAQPQVGTSHAAWIYEVEAEGGITRMIAVFSDMDDIPNMGSIRSVRPYYLSIARSYDAILVHAGGSEPAYAELASSGYEHLDGVRDDAANAAVFWRDASRGAHGTEHTLFLHADQVAAYAEQRGIRMEHNGGYTSGLNFSDDAAKQGVGAANTVSVAVTPSKNTSFTYHADTGMYTAAQYGADYVDGGNNELVNFANVMVLNTTISMTGDEKNHNEVVVVGSGTGYLVTGGQYVPIKWSRASEDSPFIYTLEDGSPLYLSRGATYCCIINNGSSVTFG